MLDFPPAKLRGYYLYGQNALRKSLGFTRRRHSV